MNEEIQDVQEVNEGIKEASKQEEQPDVMINLVQLNALITVAAEAVTYAKLAPIVADIERNIKIVGKPASENDKA